MSRDQTCKVYSIAGGQLLLSVSFTTPLLSVTMDSASQDVYTGVVELLSRSFFSLVRLSSPFFVRYEKLILQHCHAPYSYLCRYGCSVADPDPGSRIRCLFGSGIWDSGWVCQDPGSGSGMNNLNHISESLEFKISFLG